MKTDLRTRRALRGSAAAVSATFIALTSHLLGGGSLPTAMGVIVPLALSILVCVLLAGRRLRLSRLAPSVIVSQGLFHLLFSVFTTMQTVSATAPMNAVERHTMTHAGMHGATGTPMPMAGPGAPMTMADAPMTMADAGAGMHAHTSAPMMIMHLIAAVVTIALIYWSEALPARLTDFARLIIGAIVPTLARVRALPERLCLPVAATPTIPLPRVLRHSPVLRRGPPLSAF